MFHGVICFPIFCHKYLHKLLEFRSTEKGSFLHSDIIYRNLPHSAFFVRNSHPLGLTVSDHRYCY